MLKCGPSDGGYAQLTGTPTTMTQKRAADARSTLVAIQGSICEFRQERRRRSRYIPQSLGLQCEIRYGLSPCRAYRPGVGATAIKGTG